MASNGSDRMPLIGLTTYPDALDAFTETKNVFISTEA